MLDETIQALAHEGYVSALGPLVRHYADDFEPAVFIAALAKSVAVCDDKDKKETIFSLISSVCTTATEKGADSISRTPSEAPKRRQV